MYVSLGELYIRMCVCMNLLPLISRTAAIIQHTRCYSETRVPATVAASPLQARIPSKRLIEF